MGIKEELQAFIVRNPGIALRPGEVCFFFAKGSYGTPYTQTTTKVKPGVGLGVVVPVTKHFGLGLGKQKVKTETSTQTVWQKEPCQIYVMDSRIAVTIKGGVMDIDLGSVTNLKLHKDALTVSCGSKDHVLFMHNSDVKRFMNLFNLIVQAEQMGLDSRDFAPQSPAAPAASSYAQSSDSQPQTLPETTVSADYAKTVFLWYVGRKPTPIKKRDDYPQYLFYSCNIQNAPKFHRDMIEQGYLTAPSAEELLATLKVTELKEILQENNLPTTGKKAALVQSILANVPAERLCLPSTNGVYVLSEYGKKFLEAHDDYVKLHLHSGWGITQAEYDAEKAATPSVGFNGICWRIFNRRISKTRKLNEYRNIYYNMSTLAKEEERYKDALSLLLRVLYIDLSGAADAGVQGIMEGWLNRQEDVERVASGVFFAPALIKGIGDLEESFSEDMLPALYQWQLPVNLCPNSLFSDMVHSVLAGTFDEEKYKNYLAAEYRNRLTRR